LEFIGVDVDHIIERSAQTCGLFSYFNQYHYIGRDNIGEISNIGVDGFSFFDACNNSIDHGLIHRHVHNISQIHKYLKVVHTRHLHQLEITEELDHVVILE
jgi:CTP:phosphocholine cytidylyltransferase-like protein